jgi:hypothetical protein
MKKANNLIKNLYIVIIVLLIIVIGFISYCFIYCSNEGEKLIIENKMVEDKYHSLVKILGKPNYIEKCSQNNMKTATWMSPLDNFPGMGKYGGADYIKIHGKPSKKWHPHPANVFLIVGKYINVPEHLFGPIKYASETINIEQLFIPENYSMKYYNTGVKELALVTGSCASVAISAITVQFVIDMIEKHKDDIRSLELYEEFRNEYDRRIDDYLCGRGITDTIPWFDHNFFEEGESAYLGDEICLKSSSANANNTNNMINTNNTNNMINTNNTNNMNTNNMNKNNMNNTNNMNKNNNVMETFTHYPECKALIQEDSTFCRTNPEHRCC